MKKIPVYKPCITEVEKKYVNECLDTEWISSRGKFVDQFEGAFADYIGVKYAISCSNGTTALHVALLALGIGPGDEVIVPTLTYIASANAVTYTGAKPIFVDSAAGTWQIDVDDVRRAITARTRAIMAVHLYGQACNMNEIVALARDHDLLVVEDCAEAIGTRIGAQHVGTFGDIASFSFYGNKTITTGEGGMVVTNNPTLRNRTSHLKGQGLAEFREYWHDIIGYNYRMTNICAAIGCAQLERIDSTLAKKREIAGWYRARLADAFEFQVEERGTTHSHWMVCLLVESADARDPLRNRLAQGGVETRPVFYPVHSMPMYAHAYRRMPVADDVASRGINLPSYPDLAADEIEYICSLLTERQS
ncbi:MAG: DegT/DnrJ/EryC1/StrS family aminotransferase [Planctomycetaceae bacterium]